jgi:hypothetical protein
MATQHPQMAVLLGCTISPAMQLATPTAAVGCFSGARLGDLSAIVSIQVIGFDKPGLPTATW